MKIIAKTYTKTHAQQNKKKLHIVNKVGISYNFDILLLYLF